VGTRHGDGQSLPGYVAVSRNGQRNLLLPADALNDSHSVSQEAVRDSGGGMRQTAGLGDVPDGGWSRISSEQHPPDQARLEETAPRGRGLEGGSEREISSRTGRETFSRSREKLKSVACQTTAGSNLGPEGPRCVSF